MLRIKVFLETILLYLASKCKQTKGQTDQKSGQQRLFMDPYFYFFMWLLSVFFSLFCQDENKTGSNCAIIGCNLSMKHKLALHQTERRAKIRRS